MRLASALYRALKSIRSFAGATDVALVRRNGPHWELDLREGIDLAIFAFGSFERETVRALKKLVTPGSTVLDIGANNGANTLNLGRLGRGMLKIDVQFSEHLVLEGATKFLQQIDFIFVEVSLKRFLPNIWVYGEMIEFLRTKGFEYFDHAGAWRDPTTGELLQQDVVFARSNR